MAKKIKDINTFATTMDFLEHLDPKGVVLANYSEIDPSVWVHSGSYILNAHLSSSLMRGWPNNKIMVVAGDPKTGKSFEIYNAIYSFQQLGYIAVLMETENAIDRQRLQDMGIDLSKIWFKQPRTVEDIIEFGVQLAFKAQQAKRAKQPVPKLMFIIDSISSLNSRKQYNDALDGDLKSDMGTIAKFMGMLVNMMAVDLGELGWPMFLTAHVYEKDTNNFKEKKISGGMKSIYLASIVTLLEKFFERDDETKERTGIRVRSSIIESRYSAHKTINFFLPFKKKMNQYFGLQDFVSWEVCGIDKGKFAEFVDLGAELLRLKHVTKDDFLTKIFTNADLKKLLAKGKQEFLKEQILENLDKGLIAKVDGDSGVYNFTKKAAKQFDKEGKYTPIEDVVGIVNKGASQYIIKHLKKVIPMKDAASLFFTKEVFTTEVLTQLDEAVIKPLFQYASAKDEDATVKSTSDIPDITEDVSAEDMDLVVSSLNTDTATDTASAKAVAKSKGKGK